jgi:sulfate transport system substrate-binding protein
MFKKLNFLLLLICLGLALLQCNSPKDVELLHVSFDTTREIFAAINSDFQKTHPNVKIHQSHGGSTKQAGYVTAGLRADIVTLALPSDIDTISQKGFLNSDWRNHFPNHSTPFYSVIVFLVRKGNPRKITDWSSLLQEGVQIITPNPKTSGGGKWNFLALYGYALETNSNDKVKALQFLKNIYSHVPVMDTGARGAVATFLKRNIGDVLLIWENEAFLAIQESKGELEIVYPPKTILTEPSISLVDRSIQLKNTKELSESYLSSFYSDNSQNTFAVHGFRPYNQAILEMYRSKYPDVKTFRAEDIFPNWSWIQKEIFGSGKIADEVFQ